MISLNVKSAAQRALDASEFALACNMTGGANSGCKFLNSGGSVQIRSPEPVCVVFFLILAGSAGAPSVSKRDQWMERFFITWVRMSWRE